MRTGRVDLFYRAVLFRVPGQHEPTYVFYGIWPHNEAIAVAKKTGCDRTRSTGSARSPRSPLPRPT